MCASFIGQSWEKTLPTLLVNSSTLAYESVSTRSRNFKEEMLTASRTVLITIWFNKPVGFFFDFRTSSLNNLFIICLLSLELFLGQLKNNPQFWQNVLGVNGLNRIPILVTVVINRVRVSGSGPQTPPPPPLPPWRVVCCVLTRAYNLLALIWKYLFYQTLEIGIYTGRIISIRCGLDWDKWRWLITVGKQTQLRQIHGKTASQDCLKGNI